MTLKRRFFSAVLFSICVNSVAAQTPQVTRAEIDMLLKKLQISGCQFNRNGTWYTSAEAQSHLSKKLEYFEKKGMINTTEDFIKFAASSSSTSGKAYQVKCGNEAAVESNNWLNNQLKTLRAGK
ncbi:DUF5329 domain-containing protein [Undibacterium danionis]|uniref:DUF5329 domain-containing protein n=1 Tax=Undibacterium danionis TaxID=1812100 RepID=A0ABV6IE47_9BURK